MLRGNSIELVDACSVESVLITIDVVLMLLIRCCMLYFFNAF